MDEAPRTRLAAYALCQDGARLLLCRIAPGYPAERKWTLPGGGVGFGEDPADAVLRELREETGLSGRVEQLAFVNSITGRGTVEDRRGRAWHGVRIAYLVNVTGGVLRDEVDESSDRAEWVALANIPARPVVDLVGVAVAWLRQRGHAAG